MMLECSETVTVVRHVQTTDSDSYTCEVIVGVSWFGKSGAGMNDRAGEAPQKDYIVRIPAPSVPPELPKAGDILVRGVLAEYTDYRSLKGREFFRIETVGDNRRGKRLPHLVVKSQ